MSSSKEIFLLIMGLAIFEVVQNIYMENENINKLLISIFEKAKETDEFEFCCAILRMKGLELLGQDPLVESIQFMRQLHILIKNLHAIEDELRLFFSLYCHATEIDDVYSVVLNLLNIINGQRYSINPFLCIKGKDGKKIKYPHQKVEAIMSVAQFTGFEEVGRRMEDYLVKNVRNAFYHSDYVIYEDNFNIRHGKGVLVNGIITREVPLNWLVPKMKQGIDFVVMIIRLIEDYRMSYRQEKIVDARMGINEEIEKFVLIGDENYGLVGFKSL